MLEIVMAASREVRSINPNHIVSIQTSGYYDISIEGYDPHPAIKAVVAI